MIHSLAIISPDMQQRIGQQNITFAPGINIIVGSNGTGKSSLINLITEITSGSSENGRLIWDPTVPVHTYNAEQATKDRTNDTATFGVHDSHGQALRRYLSVIEKLENPSIVILDEPETALDYFAVEELCRAISKKKQIQFIISTHHPLMMTLSGANFINLDRVNKNYAKDVLSRLEKRLSKVSVKRV